VFIEAYRFGKGGRETERQRIFTLVLAKFMSFWRGRGTREMKIETSEAPPIVGLER
jgi:hypothetical protein